MVGVEILQQSEPYFLPGYTGYCPQSKYICGATTGNASHKLLLDPGVDHADKLILVDRTKTPEVTKPSKADLEVVESRSKRTDPIYTQPMLPGYAGFVPHLGLERNKPFGIKATEAIANFERDQVKRKEARDQLRKTIELQCGFRHPQNVEERLLLRSKFKLPLIMVRPERAGIIQSQPVKEPYVDPKYYHTSPYFMDNLNPEKYFINGYTGTIPYRQVHFGKPNKAVTNDSLREFTSNYSYKKQNDWAPVTLTSGNRQHVSTKGSKIYRKDSPIMPTYTGHVPGVKYKIGKTYGYNSKGAYKYLEEHLFKYQFKNCDI